MFIDSRNSLCALASSAFSLAASAKTANCYFSYLSVWYLWVSAVMHTYITHLYKPLISYNMCSLCKLEPIKMWDIMSACWTRDKDAAKSRIIWDAWPPYPQPIVLHARYVGGMRVYGSIDVKEIPSSFFIYFVQHKSSIDIFITLQETVSLNLCPHSRAITFPLNAYLFLWLCLLLLACLTTFFFLLPFSLHVSDFLSLYADHLSLSWSSDSTLWLTSRNREKKDKFLINDLLKSDEMSTKIDFPTHSNKPLIFSTNSKTTVSFRKFAVDVKRKWI